MKEKNNNSIYDGGIVCFYVYVLYLYIDIMSMSTTCTMYNV